jgi:hypothetical protein
MRHVRAAVAVIALLVCSLAASADTCPATPPPYQYYQGVTFAGTNCASGLGGTCGIAQPIAFQLSVPSYAGNLQPCDVVTWQFGDGTSVTMPPGVFTSSHTYATAGSYQVFTSITNALGTQANIYYPTSVVVANGYLQFASGSPYYYSPSFTVTEGNSAVVTVQRTNGNGPASVHYATSNGSAVSGQQYVESTGTLNFADGELQKTITIDTIDDHVFHPYSLSFNVSLSAPTGGFLVAPYSNATVSITDVDPRPLLSFETAAYTVTENVGSLPVRLLRSGDINSTVSVSYTVGSSNASISSNGVVTFFAGETTKTIIVPIIDDAIWTGDREFGVSLNGATNYAGYIISSTYITVKDNEPPPTLSFADVRVIEGNSGTTTITLTATLSAPLQTYLYVTPVLTNQTARYGTDYVVSNCCSSNAIPAGQLSTTFDVQILGNTKPEPDKTFQFGANANIYPTLLPVRPATVTIVNDDAEVTPARLSISRGGTAQLVANFGSAPATPQTVTLTSSDPSVVSVPASVTVSSASLIIPITGKAAGKTMITSTVPAAYGGGTYTTDVYVYDGAVMLLSPATVSVPVGGTATITASMSPALDTAEGAALTMSGSGAITMPDRVTVDANGTSTFTITGVRKGLVGLIATLGTNRGNAVTTISVTVTDPSTTPSISQISPANGPAAGGTSITMNGANLRGDCTISFGGVPATNVAFISASSMTATTPEHAAGAADVTLSCGSDTFNLARGFTYLAASPTISNVTPSFGNTAGGTVVTITGTNIASGCWPFFDGTASRAATVSGPTEMVAATPAHAAPGTVALVLRCSSTADATLANAFTYSSAPESSPVITGVDPLVGSAGKTVTISGARFRYDDAVTFDAVPATILATSPGMHVARIPELPLGKTSINVTDSGGHTSTTGPIFTTVEPQPPQIATVTPATTRPANEVTLDGSGFRPGYSFTIGDQPAPILSLTYTRVVVRVPQLPAGSYGVNVLNAASNVAAVGPQINVLAAGLAITRATPGCTTTDGGGRMTINGSGFVAGAVVTFDGVNGTAVSVDNAQTITVTLPALPAHPPRIVVTNPNGDTASLSNAVIVSSPFDPNSCVVRPRAAHH